MKLLQDVCSASDELPTSYFLTGVEIDYKRRIGIGGEAEIFAGLFRGRMIAARQRSLADPIAEIMWKVNAL